jgi:hypothetical protein
MWRTWNSWRDDAEWGMEGVRVGRIWTVTSGSICWSVGGRMWRLVYNLTRSPVGITLWIQFTSLCAGRISRERTLNYLPEKDCGLVAKFGFGYERWLESQWAFERDRWTSMWVTLGAPEKLRVPDVTRIVWSLSFGVFVRFRFLFLFFFFFSGLKKMSR